MKKIGFLTILLSAIFATACSGPTGFGFGGGEKTNQPATSEDWGWESKTDNPQTQPTSYPGDSSYDDPNDYVHVGGHVHTQGAIISWVDATYDEPGYYIYACRTCGSLVYMTIPQLERDYSVGLEYEINATNDGYVVTGIGTCTDSHVVIPEYYQDEYTGIELPVTEIGDRAFFEVTFIITVRCPGTIEEIGDKAFSGCVSLEEITLPDNVTYGVDVFRDTIYVEIVFEHHLVYYSAKEATCYEEGWIAHYECEDCHRYFADPEGREQIYSISIAPSHHFVDGVCTNCYQYQREICIEYVDSVAFLGRFPLGTLETAIGLPSYINVYTMDGYSHQLSVVWDLSTYDKSSVGTYEIYGYIQANGYIFISSELSIVTAELEITDVMVGTADIVFVLDISGSMRDELNNVKNNLVSFANSVDAAGVSARYSIITFSDYTEYPETNAAEQTQIIYNGANKWYTDAASAANSINSIVLAIGGDEPECDIDGLMMANYDLDYRQDARRFYILLTDASYKENNHYGVSSYDEALNILKANAVCVSVITTSLLANSTYYSLYTETGGTYLDIDSSNFGTGLTDYLLPIIFQRVED